MILTMHDAYDARCRCIQCMMHTMHYADWFVSQSVQRNRFLGLLCFLESCYQNKSYSPISVGSEEMHDEYAV